MIQIAVTDDDPIVLCELSQKLTHYFKKRHIPAQIQTFRSGQALLSCACFFDIVFLDIQMEHLSGMDAAKYLRTRQNAGILVFITALPEYVYDAFDVDASGYLLKPVDETRLARLLDRLCEKLGQADMGQLLLTLRGNIRKTFFLRDIIYCEAFNHRVEIHEQASVQECRIKIEDLERQLDGRFFRCHRSYLVNLDYVCGYEDGLALLTGGGKLPVSRLRMKAFSQAALHYMKEGKTP